MGILTRLISENAHSQTRWVFEFREPTNEQLLHLNLGAFGYFLKLALRLLMKNMMKKMDNLVLNIIIIHYGAKDNK